MVAGQAPPGAPTTGALAPEAPLDATETRQLDTVRRFGTVGALLMAIGSLGAGAAPVLGNPVVGRPVLGLFSRMPPASLAVAYLGMFMVVLGWLWLGRWAAPGRARLLSRAQLDRTVVMWAVPLAIAPPMFSSDVYTYLGQSAIADRGLDPYQLGPAEGLGVDHPLTRGVPNIWRTTPAPYGPLFLTLSRPITWVAENDVVLGVILQRLLALAGLVLIVWALPRLARRVGVPPVAALWLGAANPLVLFHLVSGAHNEALMLGLMLAGLEVALRGSGVGWPLVAGVTLVSLASAIKVPAVLALGFLGLRLARHWGGRLPEVARAAGVLAALAGGVTLLVTMATGLGFGWIGALDTPSLLRSWTSVSTDLGLLGGRVGTLFGLGDHTDTVLAVTRGLGYLLAAAVLAWMLWSYFRGRVELLAGLGVALGALVLLGPVVHPWYLLWAVLPLAASTTRPAFRTGATVACVVLAVLVPPTGAGFAFRAWVVPSAVAAALLALVVTLLLVRGKVPPARELLLRA